MLTSFMKKSSRRIVGSSQNDKDEDKGAVTYLLLFGGTAVLFSLGLGCRKYRSSVLLFLLLPLPFFSLLLFTQTLSNHDPRILGILWEG